MPGYVIHLAVGKVYAQNNKIEDLNVFERGIIEPDMVENKAISHYGPYSSQPGLNQFVKANGISSSYNEGYFLHLVTDYLFYQKFLSRWDKAIYDDYNKLNSRLLRKTELTECESLAADTNSDAIINITDYNKLNSYLLKKVTTLN